MEHNLEDSILEGIEELSEKWEVDENSLIERFFEIYESKSVQENEDLETEEELQDYSLEKLTVEVVSDTGGIRPQGVSWASSVGTNGVDLRLYDEGDNRVPPLSYSTGKDQSEVVEEILEAFESSDIVFMKGVVGSGKSVVGIRTALEYGGGVVSVPTKVLQDQYRRDYEDDKYFLKENGGKAKIRVLKGRGNFICPYMEDEHPEWEYNSCQNRSLPCSRPLAENESRMDALKECPYWGFIFPTSTPVKRKDEHVGTYKSLLGKHSLLLKGGCPYWEQFRSYLSSDVIVLNSKKWEIESMIGRLPKFGLTVIDEADAWLDGLCSKISLTEKRVSYLLNELKDGDLGHEAEEVKALWGEYKEGYEDPLPLAEDLIDILEMTALGSNLYWNLRRVLEFEEEVVVEEEEDSITYYIPDPRPILQDLRERVGGKWLLMSATLQDEDVLKRIYGIDPVFVEGEVKFPGKLIHKKVNAEERVNNRNWKKSFFRKRYKEVRDEILRRAERPGFVPVHATKYLPDGIDDLTKEDQKNEDGLVFSTKMDRGADLGDMKSVILLKYPYPGLGDPLLKAMRKRLGEKKFWMYYHDMAEREFIQQVGRTLRSPDDEVEFWSPDKICHNKLHMSWRGKIVGEE